MDKHTTAKVPEWELIEASDRNVFQRVAAKTKGIVGLANLATATGLSVTLWGINDVANADYKSGIPKILAGRLLDIADGFLAKFTRTKSPLGEGFDATSDKIAMAAGLIALTRAEVLPIGPAVVIGGQNVANAAFTGIAKLRGQEVHPSESGKINTLVQWLSIGSYIVASAVDPGAAHNAFETFGMVSAYGGTVLLGGDATIQLADDALKPQQTDQAA